MIKNACDKTKFDSSKNALILFEGKSSQKSEVLGVL